MPRGAAFPYSILVLALALLAPWLDFHTQSIAHLRVLVKYLSLWPAPILAVCILVTSHLAIQLLDRLLTTSLLAQTADEAE